MGTAKTGYNPLGLVEVGFVVAQGCHAPIWIPTMNPQPGQGRTTGMVVTKTWSHRRAFAHDLAKRFPGSRRSLSSSWASKPSFCRRSSALRCISLRASFRRCWCSSSRWSINPLLITLTKTMGERPGGREGRPVGAGTGRGKGPRTLARGRGALATCAEPGAAPLPGAGPRRRPAPGGRRIPRRVPGAAPALPGWPGRRRAGAGRGSAAVAG